MEKTPLACSHHNHNHCIKDALASAHNLCESRGVRLTSLREQVLELIWQNHKPLGAYTLMDMLATASTRRVAPPTVYRALDFLLEQGLVHRINGLNAFIGCPSPEKKHQSHFLICRSCNTAIELDSTRLTQDIQLSAKDAGFSVESHSLEVMGICSACSAQPAKNKSLKEGSHS
jgi:Fur family zinc uptake transcriptional regulator